MSIYETASTALQPNASDLTLAAGWRRIAARLVDLVVPIFFGWIWSGGVSTHHWWGDTGTPAGDAGRALIFGIVFVGYEFLMNRSKLSSFGKSLFRIKVLSADGQSLSNRQNIHRALIFPGLATLPGALTILLPETFGTVLDVLISLFVIIDLGFYFSDRPGMTLHDRWANSLVVKAPKKTS